MISNNTKMDKEDQGQTSAFCIRQLCEARKYENLDPINPKTPMDDAVGNQRLIKKK